MNQREQIQEIIKCGSDPIYFISTYIKIQSPLVGEQSLNLFKYQKNCINSCLEHRFIAICKSRQMGITTILCAFALWKAIFHKDQTILFAVCNLHMAKSHLKKIKFMFDNLPDWLKIPNVTHSLSTSIQFNNNSRIDATVADINSGCSTYVDLLILDEFAYITNAKEIFTSLWPCISPNGKLIVVSTPKLRTSNEEKGKFEEICTSENEFFKIHLPWDLHPKRSQKWFDEQVKIGGELNTKIELLAEFAVKESLLDKKEELKKLIRQMEETLTQAKKLLDTID